MKVFTRGALASQTRRTYRSEKVRWMTGIGTQGPQTANTDVGGDGKTMMAGITVVVAGFGVFWYLQAWKQGRNALQDPHGKVPTWHHRMAQEEHKAFPRVPGQTLVSTPTATIQPSETLSLPNDGKDRKPDVIAQMFDRVHGKQNPDVVRVEQPAPPKRFHESGRVYTKKFDDVPGYKREDK